MISAGRVCGLGLVLVCAVGLTKASIPLETETARTIAKHHFETDAAFEYQKSADGYEMAVPMALEYGILENLELLVEPVLYTAIRPDTGRKATGLGDLEVTLNYRFMDEKGVMPALGVAAEAKVAIANDRLIGTGKSDYAGYLIASKNLGVCDLHGNLGYTLVGQPSGVRLNNLFSFSIGVEQISVGQLQLLGEVFGNIPSPFEVSGNAPENPITPEASGGELVGTLGARFFFKTNFAMTLGVTYDNSNALQLAPGFIVLF